MRIGIGLPAAVPGSTAAVPEWAAEADRLGFESLGVLDRLVYDNLDPLVALAAAAATSERAELMATVLNVPYRQNPVLLAKQLASIEQLSGGRLTVGLALGGWPADYTQSDLPLAGRGAVLDAALARMRQVWAGEVPGASGPMPALAEGRPGVLMGGLVPASFERIAAHGEGWVAPFMGLETLTDGAQAVRRAWSEAGRPGAPRIVVERYFSLGPGAGETADHYLEHYYGSEYFAVARADTLTSAEELRAELDRLAEVGCDDLLLFPCSGDLRQVALLAEALEDQLNKEEPSR